MNYFYIIERKGAIWEIPYTQKNHQIASEQFQSGGLIEFPSRNSNIPITINAVDVTGILPYDGYISWIDTAEPKKYIIDGSWYDSKEKKIVRHEKWKQLEIDKKLALKEQEKQAKSADPKKYKEALKDKGII